MVVLFLVLLFCTKAGLVPAFIVSGILLVAGLVGLRKKVAADPVRSPA